MENETEEQKQARVKLLMASIELTKTGYAGIDKNGNKVDRRLFPDAVPLLYNLSLFIPHPKEIKNLKKGTRVIMFNCGEADHYKDKVWNCRTDSFFPKHYNENEMVYLEGFAGWFLCDFLKVVE